MVDRAAGRIVRDVREWLADRADEDVICCLEVLLEARQNWLSVSDPTLWKSGDAHRLLIDTAAPRLTDKYGMPEHGPTALRALADFLDETDRFHPASMRTVAFRKELDRAEAKFPAAMADEPGWRPAKRMFMAMLADGVDIADDDAVATWTEAFNAAPERRQEVLGVLLDRQPELALTDFAIRDGQVAAVRPGAPIPPEFRRNDLDDGPVNPPVSLPPATELAKGVRNSALLRKLVACGQWAAPGQKVTKHGFPTPAGTRSFGAAAGINVREGIRDPRAQIPLIRIWRLALDVEVLQLHRTQVVAGPALAEMERLLAGDTGPEETLTMWQPIADVAISGPAQPDVHDEHARKLEEFCRPWGPRALGDLYRTKGEIDLEDLIETLIDTYHGPSISDTLASLTGAAVRTGLLAGLEAGAVAVTAPPDTDASTDTDPARRIATLLDEPTWAIIPTPGTRAALTPLGRHFVRVNLLAEGTAAPLLAP